MIKTIIKIYNRLNICCFLGIHDWEEIKFIKAKGIALNVIACKRSNCISYYLKDQNDISFKTK